MIVLAVRELLYDLSIRVSVSLFTKMCSSAILVTVRRLIMVRACPIRYAQKRYGTLGNGTAGHNGTKKNRYA